MPEQTWPEVERRLTAVVSALSDGGFVIVGDRPAPAGEPRGLRRRRPRPMATRFTQVVRHRDWWHAECVGAASFGGDWPLDAVHHEQVRRSGWLAPGDADETGTQPAAPVYWRTLAVGDPAPVVTLMVTALRILGLEPGSLSWTES